MFMAPSINITKNLQDEKPVTFVRSPFRVMHICESHPTKREQNHHKSTLKCQKKSEFICFLKASRSFSFAWPRDFWTRQLCLVGGFNPFQKYWGWTQKIFETTTQLFFLKQFLLFGLDGIVCWGDVRPGALKSQSLNDSKVPWLYKASHYIPMDTPPSSLTWHWKIPIFNRKYIFKWWMFHCHVSFRGRTWDWLQGGSLHSVINGVTWSP